MKIVSEKVVRPISELRAEADTDIFPIRVSGFKDAAPDEDYPVRVEICGACKESTANAVTMDTLREIHSMFKTAIIESERRGWR